MLLLEQISVSKVDKLDSLSFILQQQIGMAGGDIGRQMERGKLVLWFAQTKQSFVCFD